jgi:putative PEP-CTERM system histidine kinase
MPALPADIWSVLALLLHVTAAIGAATLSIWLRPRAGRLGTAGLATVAALLVTALWSLAEAVELRGSLAASILESARNVIWLFVVYRFFAGDGRHDSLAPIRPVLFALIFVELLLFGLDISVAQLPLGQGVEELTHGLGTTLRLLVSVGALVLVHNLYGGASSDARLALRWPAAALATVWIFDLNLYTVAYLSETWPREIAAIRGLATITLVSLFAIGASHGREALRLRPSRAVTFQTFSLLLIGIYLVGMVLVAQWLAYAGGDFARLIELCFLTIASAVALLVLPSRRLRGWLRVVVTKHMFQHRYDYREEWLRFTRTIGNTGPDAPSLGERVVQALADVTGSPGGALLVCEEGGNPVLEAHWNWPTLDGGSVTIAPELAATLERDSFIVELDDLRSAHAAASRDAGGLSWLLEDAQAWALVPLVHYDRMIGIVVLARPQVARKLDWEDFDLLRVIGQQLASYLAESATQDALAEASRFDEFHRRIAFVMHDIKNLASQFSLLARNAELHAEKKAFRDDMLVTLRNSSEKLNALIARLSRYGSGVDRIEAIPADEVARAVAMRFDGQGQVVLAQCSPLWANANRHSLEQVLVHLVQNAVDASPEGSRVFLSLVAKDDQARFEVVDSGVGMSPEFIRTRLFKPFVSTKSGGFGIGAFEARELVKAMRGNLEVASREGQGSRFVVRVPLATAAHALSERQCIDQNA